MDGTAFPAWMGIGGYGGLTCAVVAAAALAVWALVYRRGTTSQSAMAILICLVCAALMIFPLWWEQARLQFLGSSLDDIEVAVVLTWIALFGWTLPLGMLVSFVLLAEPHTPGERPSPRRSPLLEATLRLSLADPARYHSVRDDDAPWAQLAMVGEEQQTPGARPLLLRRRLTLIGREVDNDIILNDERISRHHAEIRMDHTVAVLRDYDSMNGTMINKQPVIQQAPLKVGDILELGMRRYRYSLLDGATVYEVETSKMPGASGVNRKQTLPPAGPPALVAVNGAAEGSRWNLLEPVNSIGRDPTCQIQLPDTTVSRRHAQVVRQTDGYYASDLESINGTKVNEDDLKAPRRLIHGDLLRLGTVALRFETTLPLQSEGMLNGEGDNQPPTSRVSSGQITIPFTRGADLLPLDDDQPPQP